MAGENDYFTSIQKPQVYRLSGRWAAALKPAGMHCAGPGTDTLAQWAFDMLPGASSVTGLSPGEGGLLHRLDRDTSGLVLFALDQGAFDAITEAAAAGRFVKRYLALARPVPAGLPGSRPELAVPAGADERAWLSALRRADLPALAAALRGRAMESRFRPYGPGRMKVSCARAELPVNAGKDWTSSLYRTLVLEAAAAESGILARVELARGFRHQVRAHLAWHGLPLAGDRSYGEGDGPLCLLAYGLSFPDPDGGRAVSLDWPPAQGEPPLSPEDRLANTESTG